MKKLLKSSFFIAPQNFADFGLLKPEIKQINFSKDDYTNYYNYNRIKEKLKGLSPVNYRLQSSRKYL